MYLFFFVLQQRVSNLTTNALEVDHKEHSFYQHNLVVQANSANLWLAFRTRILQSTAGAGGTAGAGAVGGPSGCLCGG